MDLKKVVIKAVVVRAIGEGIYAEMPRLNGWEMERRNYAIELTHTHHEHYAGDTVYGSGRMGLSAQYASGQRVLSNGIVSSWNLVTD